MPRLGRALGLGLLIVGSVAQIACAGGQVPAQVAPVELTGKPAVQISPDEFAGSAAAALQSSARDLEAKLLLAGVTQYQLKRAEQLFADGHVSRAEDVVTGALLLLRHDDELESATRGRGKALLDAAHAAARSGDAGRAKALYHLAHDVLTDGATRSDIEQHLEAISRWNANTEGSSPLLQAGEGTRRALSYAVVDPRAKPYISARNHIVEWMKEALKLSNGEGAPASRAERELAMEAYRAIRTGAPAMIALNLRQGTPGSAVVALEDADLDRALPPGVRALLKGASQDNDPGAWLELFRQLESLREEGGSETQLPRYLADGAALWSAIGLYRSSPGDVQHVMPLSMTLVEFGMPEVASALLSGTTNESTSDEALAWSVSLVLRGLLELSQSEQLLAARRSFQEAEPLFKLAERDGYRGPSPARARLLMAALETRYGHVERALPLLKSSLALEENAGVYLRLSQLQSQSSLFADASSSLKKAVTLAQKSGNLLLESKAEEALFRAYRSLGKKEDAAAALNRALSRALVLRKMEVALRETAPVERQVASLLGYYGRSGEQRAAYERALTASRSSLIELEVTLTDMARAALTHGDIRLGRMATQSALDFGLPAENSIYIALWQQLLEHRNQVTRDGLPREVLMRAGKARGWLGALRKFGLGEVAVKELSSAASGIPEKTEASFYTLMNGSTEAVALKKIAASPAVDLIEVRIAQDLVASIQEFELPEDLELP